MFTKKPIDILTIGDMTTDAFIRLENADLHCTVDRRKCELCLPFGAKVPFEYVKVVKGVGNAANAAVAAARLGLNTAIISDVGDDENGRGCVAELKRNRVSTQAVTEHPHMSTNYHFVLWHDDDRTILVNHVDYGHSSLSLSSLKRSAPKWLYLTSFANNASLYERDVIAFLDAHPGTRLSFQPGTFQIASGLEKLAPLLMRTDVIAVNREEAQKLLDSRSADIRILLSGIQAHGPKLVLITDGHDGAYMFDGDHYYHMPIYPDARPAFERTGCGDAFAATFVSALAMGKSPLEALVWAPVNPMSVAQFVGSQEGLLSLEQMEWWLSRAPADYKPKEI